MKKFDPMLMVLVVVVGVFTYFVAFKGVVHLWMLPILVVLTAVWYVTTALVTKGMVKKNRKGEAFFYSRASLVSSDETELISGALVVTGSEIVFYRRAGYLGGVKPVWSAFTSQIESYSLEKVDEKHDGIILKMNNSENSVKVASKSLKKREDELREALGW